MINIPFAFMAGQSGAPSYLLDTYSGATMAYSVRQLSGSASNSLLAIKSDSSTQNIGFDSNGYLDTASLLSFAAGGDVGVKTWYDQTGNGNDLTVSAFSDAPAIVLSGTLQTANSLATVRMTNYLNQQTTISTATPVTSTDSTSVYFIGTKSISTNTYVFGGTASASAPAVISEYGGVDFEWFCGGTERYTLSASGGSTTNLSSFGVTRSTGTNNLKGYFGGSNVFTQTATSNLSSANYQTLGGSSPTQDFFQGRVSEWIVWAGTNNDSDASGIMTDQIAYFSV